MSNTIETIKTIVILSK